MHEIWKRLKYLFSQIVEWRGFDNEAEVEAFAAESFRSQDEYWSGGDGKFDEFKLGIIFMTDMQDVSLKSGKISYKLRVPFYFYDTVELLPWFSSSNGYGCKTSNIDPTVLLFYFNCDTKFLIMGLYPYFHFVLQMATIAI